MIRATGNTVDDAFELKRAELRAQYLGGERNSRQQRAKIFAARMQRSEDLTSRSGGARGARSWRGRIEAECCQDIAGGFDQKRAFAKQAVRPSAGRVARQTRYGSDFAAEFECPVHGVHGAGAFAALNHDDGLAEGRDQAVALREVKTARRVVIAELADDCTPRLRDAQQEFAAVTRIGLMQTGTQHGNHPSAHALGTMHGCLIDAARGPGNDDDSGPGKACTEAGGKLAAFLTAGTCANQADAGRARRELRQLTPDSEVIGSIETAHCSRGRAEDGRVAALSAA